MHKSPPLFVFTISLILIIPYNQTYAQALRIDINQKTYAPGDTLVLFGKGIPRDGLAVELFNPAGTLIFRTQVEVGLEGSFSRILLEWPRPPTEKFPFGVYSLVVTSSISADVRATQALRFAETTGGFAGDLGRELQVQLSVPPAIGIDEVARVVVQVTVNGVLVRGDADQTLRGSHVHFPDGSVAQINPFTVLEDGIYTADFRSSMLGHHTIHVQAFQQGLLASSAAGLFVEEGSILSLGKEIKNLKENVEGLRLETLGTVKEVGAASGQVTSLLLPIIGMIAVIVALQAAMLAKRK